MAASFAKVANFKAGNKSFGIYDVTFDNSYPSGGYAVTPQNFGLRAQSTIQHVTTGTGNVSTTFYNTVYDGTNKKIIVASGAAQVANATDLSGLTVRVKVIGT